MDVSPLPPRSTVRVQGKTARKVRENQITSATDRFPAPIAFGRDVGRRVPRLDGRPHCIRVVATICQHQRARGNQGQQEFSGPAIGRLPSGQRKGEWSSEIVGEGVELGVATASADADGLRPLPPFPPVAQRWNFIDVLSSKTSAAGPPALARVWNTSVQTPFAAQRTKQL